MATAPPSSVLVFCLMTISMGLLFPRHCMVGAIENILFSGRFISAGESLTYGNYVFTIQTDCNLVLYDRSQPVWASNTNGRGTRCSLYMQEDGNLVVYGDYHHPVWASNTRGAEGHYVCILQHDRNVVIYGSALWASNTNTVGTQGVIVSSNVTKPAAASSDGVVTADAEYVVLDSAAAVEPINRKIIVVEN